MEQQQRLVAGRYRLGLSLGSGGMGTVWRAEDVVLRRQVAVKEVTFPPGLSGEDREILCERTRREARAAARLDHPSAVTVYDVVEDDGSPYLVMELIEARTLSQVVRTDGPPTPRRTAQIGLALLGALEAAHAQGIVHRDVKPSNVLLGPPVGDDPGRVVLTDFGIASSAGDSSITSTGLLLGSPSYIAPERARGQAPAPQSDLWSLGATLFTAVEGRPPYDGGEPLLTVTAVVTGEHAPFVAAGPLQDVLEGLLERDPALRLTALQARTALVALAEHAPMLVASAPRQVGGHRAERTTALPLQDVRAAAAAEPGPDPSREAEPGWSRPPLLLDRTGRRPRSRTPFVVLGLLLAVGAGATGLVVSGGGEALRAGAAPTAPPSTAGSPGPGSSTPESSAVAAPAGWRTVTDTPGWRAAIPPTYLSSTFDGAPQYRDQNSGRTLRIAATAAGKGQIDAVSDRRTQASSFAGSHDDYAEISIAPVNYRGDQSADWEFTYTSKGASLHALSRVFVVDGRGYSLFFQTRSTDDWVAARAEFDQIAAGFQPA